MGGSRYLFPRVSVSVSVCEWNYFGGAAFEIFLG
jgi:hypothetical protein